MEKFGLNEFLEDDQEGFQENIPHMESQEVAGELMSGMDFLACM